MLQPFGQQRSQVYFKSAKVVPVALAISSALKRTPPSSTFHACVCFMKTFAGERLCRVAWRERALGKGTPRSRSATGCTESAGLRIAGMLCMFKNSVKQTLCDRRAVETFSENRVRAPFFKVLPNLCRWTEHSTTSQFLTTA
jgi:hypothetical protein